MSQCHGWKIAVGFHWVWDMLTFWFSWLGSGEDMTLGSYWIGERWRKILCLSVNTTAVSINYGHSLILITVNIIKKWSNIKPQPCFLWEKEQCIGSKRSIFNKGSQWWVLPLTLPGRVGSPVPHCLLRTGSLPLSACHFAFWEWCSCIGLDWHSPVPFSGPDSCQHTPVLMERWHLMSFLALTDNCWSAWKSHLLPLL